jgi:hypothetical protein
MKHKNIYKVAEKFKDSETDVEGGHPVQHTFKIMWAFISVSGTTEE